MTLFTREEFQNKLNITSKTTASTYISGWVSNGKLFKRASAGSRDRFTEYTFDPNKGGERDYVEEARQVFGKQEYFTRAELEKQFNISASTALSYLEKWLDKNQISRYYSGRGDSLTLYSFDLSKGGERDYLERAKQVFKMERFARVDFERELEVTESTALRHLGRWVKEGKLFEHLSKKGDTLTTYSFDPNKGGKRETEEGNRSKYGYDNPHKDSPKGLEILSKGLRADSPHPIEATSVEYHKTQARYDSKRPGSKYKNFDFQIARLGHGPEGASEHWNRIGHTQTKEQNIEWNYNPDNYWGPEHKKESDASGRTAARYIPPSKERGSHPSWLENS